MSPEQLWKPVVESSGVEAPATHVSKSLSFREVEFRSKRQPLLSDAIEMIR